ncbi:MAG: amidohydrolase [Alphaproteobacteria bacterium]
MEKLRVFTARRIRTMDPGRPVADAVAVSGDRIVSVGTLATMRPWLDRFEHEIDDRFAGKVLMPGFIDPHTHFRMSGIFMGLTYLGPIDSPGPDRINPGITTREAVFARLKEVDASLTDPEAPIVAWGSDPAVQGGQLTRDELDAVSATRPIWTVTYAPHVVVANSPMLQRIGVDESTNIYGIERDSDGRLNGQFVEREATRVATRAVAQHLNQPGQGVAAIRLLAETARAAGITTTAEMVFGYLDFDREWAEHREAVDDPAFPLRMLLVPIDSPLHERHGERKAEWLLQQQRQNTPKLGLHGVKFINDGSYPAMTLRLRFPGYLDGHEGHRGETPWDQVFEHMLPYWKAGVQIHSHANGDETVQMTLDVLERLQLAHPRFDHRFTIEHYCISTPDQARRLKALGGLASVNDYFVHYRSLLHAEQGFGPDRAEATARLGSLEREGVVFALHSDFSLVLTPIAPLTAAWIAVNRVALDGKTVQAPGERIGVERALRAITIDAAHILRRDHEIGSIEAGKLADFTVLADDPFEVAPEKLRDVAVLGTVLGGVPTGG